MRISLDSLFAVPAGSYAGEGTNHDEQVFAALMVLAPHEGGIAFSYSATGAGGMLYHREESTIAAGNGIPMLTVRSTNHPAEIVHELRYAERGFTGVQAFVFGAGDIEDREIFREEITIVLYENGDIGYSYAWGMPGGDFADRSSAHMQIQST